MTDFLHSIFLKAPGTDGDFLTEFLLGTVAILLACAITIYILTVLMLAFGAYRSDRTARYVDNDVRIKLCRGWTCLATALLLAMGIAWIRLKSLIPHDAGFLSEFRSLSCYATSLILLVGVWLTLYLTLRHERNRASATAG